MLLRRSSFTGAAPVGVQGQDGLGKTEASRPPSKVTGVAQPISILKPAPK